MTNSLRIVSLLPSATEMVCAVGGQSLLVGRSHECDFPAELQHLPVLTRPRRELPRASAGIDRSVREILADAVAVYEVDVDLLREFRPDVIVTQDLCDVCAVSLDDVQAALRELARDDVHICSLKPLRLQNVWDDVRAVGKALALPDQGEAAAIDLEQRSRELGERMRGKIRPSVLTIEWLSPVMIGGTWMPELVEIAGGTTLVTKPGEHAPTLSLEELSVLDPDVVVLKPCGFDLPRTIEELKLLTSVLPWSQWKAVSSGRVFLADGNAYFNRPGPRLVESIEILAAAIHEDSCQDLATKHRRSMIRVTKALDLLDVVDGSPFSI